MNTFKQEIEQKMGSDEALGVWFLTDAGQALTLSEFQTMSADLGPDAMPGAQSLFPDGSSAIVCTEYAVQVARQYPGRTQVVGFANEDNPTSRFAQEDSGEGHDFALVDKRYLVDLWLRLVYGEHQAVFDLEDPVDAAYVLEFYGPRKCWKKIYTRNQLKARLKRTA